MTKVIKLFDKNVESKTTRSPSMKADSFRCDIIRPALKVAGLWSSAAENLMLGTALAESGLNTVKQIAGGPALSFYQIEPKTYVDVVRYLERRSDKKDSILSSCYLDCFPEAQAVQWNLRLATLIARMVYWRKKEPLPRANDVFGMGDYWKRHYNTSLGKGTVDHYVKSWEEQ